MILDFSLLKMNERIWKEKAEAQSKSWELLRVCREIIKENEKSWLEGTKRMEMRRYEKEKEDEKEERLGIAKEKKKAAVEKHLQSRITEKFKKLTDEGRKEWQTYMQQNEEERDMRISIAEAKENLWRRREEERKDKN